MIPRPTFTHRGFRVKAWRPEDEAKIREGIDLLLDGKLERWRISYGTTGNGGGCCIDVPVDLGELGATMEAAARHPGQEVVIERVQEESPSGGHGWIRPPGVMGCIDIERIEEAAPEHAGAGGAIQQELPL